MADQQNIPATPLGVRQRVLRVTPQIAEAWLEGHNPRNRKLVNSRVATYARDMRKGRWQFNGVPIQFDTEGNLLNGQHRLWAIVESGTTQPISVWEGLDPEAQRTIDTGLGRTARQQLAMDKVPNSSVAAALARSYIIWEQGQLTSRSYVVSSSEVIEFIEKNMDAVTRVARAVAKPTATLKIPRGPLGAFVYKAFELYPEAVVDRFLDQLATGAGLDEGDPILVLRNRLVADQQKRRKNEPHVVMYYLVHTWRSALNGRKYGKLQLPMQITPAHLVMMPPGEDRFADDE
jgi:hypothetical protein